MVSDTLVEEQIEDGRRLLAHLATSHVDVTLAFWARHRDDPRWWMYVVSPEVEKSGSLATYRMIFERLGDLGNTLLTSTIKVIGASSSVALTLSEIRKRYPDLTRLKWPSPLLVGLPFDEIDMYLPSKILRIYGMTFNEEPGGSALHLSFSPHDPHRHMEVEVDGQPPKRFEAQVGIDTIVEVPLGAKIETDELGQKVLVWNFRGKTTQSTANEVWTFAKYGMHGFRRVAETN